MDYRNIGDFFSDNPSQANNEVWCEEFDSLSAEKMFETQLHLDSFVLMYVVSGSAKMSVNYRIFELSKDSAASLFDSHLFKLQEISDDFCCKCLFVPKLFMERNAPAEIVAIRAKYAVKMFRKPVMQLKFEEGKLLIRRMEEVERTLQNKSHHYYSLTVVNALMAFFLDLSHFFELHETDECNAYNMSRHELITKSFVELLAENFRQEHKVDYYADRLSVSKHYLSFLVKRVTGQTPSDFIYEMLYSEARSLLLRAELSVQEVSAMLCFSDQSSFGKFFKRRAGESPFAYKAKNVSDCKK